MPDKYHITVSETSPRFEPVGKYATVEFREDCAGSCRECVKKKCVYGIFNDNLVHMQSMETPEYLYTCNSCFRCVQECTRGIFSRVINPEYRSLGDTYYKADTIHRTWYQAHTGKVPVSGAGYRGPFVAEGFDSMWTDMSEIVRPTRDGIHGREYINTSFELSGRAASLRFGPDKALISPQTPILEIPIPLLLRLPDNLPHTKDIILASAKAARGLGTMMFIRPEDYSGSLRPCIDHLIPCLTAENYRDNQELIQSARAVDIADGPEIESTVADIRSFRSDIIILVSLPLDRHSPDRALTLSGFPIDTIHYHADSHGNEQEDDPKFLKEAIRDIHLRLVENSCRQQINLVFSGGIAMAEHMAKAIICGADAISIDNTLMLALECRLCGRCRQNLSCPVGLDQALDTKWAYQRIVNLVGAWHSQLLEVMGAMGIREARRLRGEVGRSMWFEDLEMEHFGPLFGKRKVSGLG